VVEHFWLTNIREKNRKERRIMRLFFQGLRIPARRLMVAQFWAACFGIITLVLGAGPAQAQIVTEFSAGLSSIARPNGIASGPDGNLWFTEMGSANRIGRITPAGVITEFSAGITTGANPGTITAGPDGNLWFSEASASRIGRITPAGVITEFSAGISGTAGSIAAGPDGNLWFTERSANRIGRITTAGVVTEFSAGLSPSSGPSYITAGPDGNMWFTEGIGNRIGRITMAGVITEFSAGLTASASLQAIAAGPDGNLWFCEGRGDRIGRITPAGVITEFSAGITPSMFPGFITSGPDGNMWFTEENPGGKIGRITTAGVVTEFGTGITAGAGLQGIALGPDGNLWFAEFDGVRIGRMTVTTRQALFVNSSTSTNKTSVVRIVNPTGSAGSLKANAYDESGARLGTANASLGAITANQTRTFTSAELESLIAFVPAAPTSKYSVYITADLTGLELINYTRDIATTNLTLSQSLSNDRSSNTSGPTLTRSAWFMSSSTSASKTNVLRIINTSTNGQSSVLRATAYDEAGNVYGTASTIVGTVNAHQMMSFTSAQLEAAIGFVPVSPTSKYRVVFSANLPSMELINFTKDNASGNLALVQAQVENRSGPSSGTSSRNALLVFPSTGTARTSVLRIINPNNVAMAVTASVYDEWGNILVTGSLGSVAANSILALTSSQLETTLNYPPNLNDKFRLVINADVPTFEVLNDSKVPTTGNIYLAQAQTDSRPASSGSTTTRNAYIVYPSASPVSTTQLYVVNTTAQSAALTANAYDDAGNLVASNLALGTLGPNQTLTFSSSQLETAANYTPPPDAKWRLVLSAALTNFELVNFALDVPTGVMVLAQQQTE
jgi:streptogramin lyase